MRRQSQIEKDENICIVQDELDRIWTKVGREKTAASVSYHTHRTTYDEINLNRIILYCIISYYVILYHSVFSVSTQRTFCLRSYFLCNHLHKTIRVFFQKSNHLQLFEAVSLFGSWRVSCTTVITILNFNFNLA